MRKGQFCPDSGKSSAGLRGNVNVTLTGNEVGMEVLVPPPLYHEMQESYFATPRCQSILNWETMITPTQAELQGY